MLCACCFAGLRLCLLIYCCCVYSAYLIAICWLFCCVGYCGDLLAPNLVVGIAAWRFVVLWYFSGLAWYCDCLSVDGGFG